MSDQQGTHFDSENTAPKQRPSNNTTVSPWDGPTNQTPYADQPPPDVYIDPTPTYGSSAIAGLHRHDVTKVRSPIEPGQGRPIPRSNDRVNQSGPRIDPLLPGTVLPGTVLPENELAEDERDDTVYGGHRGGGNALPRAAWTDESPAPFVVIPPPPPASVPKRSPLLAILLGLALVAAAAFAFLWHKATTDKDAVAKQVASSQTQLVDASAMAAAELAAANKAAADAAANSAQVLAAARAQATADSQAAAAKAQADQAAAVAKAAGDAQAAAAAAVAKAGTDAQATQAALQAKLDASNTALTAAQAKVTACTAVNDAVTAMIPALNQLVLLRNAESSGDQATAQSLLAAFNLDAFNAQVATLNAAQAACRGT